MIKLKKNEPSTKGLKSILKLIEDEQNKEKLKEKINQLEKYLESMKNEEKCEKIKYNKLFPILFTKLQSNNEIEKTLRIFLHLKRIYPDTIEVLTGCPGVKKLFSSIFTFKDIETQIKYFSHFTDEFKNVEHLNLEESTKMFHYVYSEYLLKVNCINFELIENFQYMLLNFYSQIKENEKKATKCNSIHNSPYIFLLIESFIDFTIYLIIFYIFNSSEGGKSNDEVIIRIMESVFTTYFCFYESLLILESSLTYKIIGVICLYYSFLNKINFNQRASDNIDNLYSIF